MAYEIFSVVFPTFFIMFVGILCKKYHLFSDTFISESGSLVFTFFMPINIFLNIATSSSATNMNLKLFFLIFTMVVLIFTIGFYFLKSTNKTDQVKATLLQSIVRSNSILFGLALTKNYYGNIPELSIIILTISIFASVSNVFAILSFEVFLVEKSKNDSNIKKMFLIIKNVFKNNLLIATLLGLVVNLLPLTVPALLIKPLEHLGAVSTPLGLLVLGAALINTSTKKTFNNVLIVVIFKNIILPLISIAVVLFFKLKGLEAFAFVICFSSPTAASNYVLAEQYAKEGLLSSKIITTTTFISSFVIFFELYFLKIYNII